MALFWFGSSYFDDEKISRIIKETQEAAFGSISLLTPSTLFIDFHKKGTTASLEHYKKYSFIKTIYKSNKCTTTEH